MIKFAPLCVPGYHRLWPSFPACSARNAIFLLYSSYDSSTPKQDGSFYQVILYSLLYLTTLFKHSSVNLFAVSCRPEGFKLTSKSLKSLGSSSFARHYSRNHWLFSLTLPTKMFQFGNLPPNALYIQAQVARHYSNWVSPFGNLRFKACLSAPRSLSQTATSFIGILRQGILYVRLSNFL